MADAHAPRPRRLASSEALRRISWGFLALTLALLALALAAGGAVRASRGCASCHAMDAYSAAHRSSPHDAVPCAGCHARAGMLGMMADGIRYGRWAAAAVTGSAPVDAYSTGCLSCHARVLSRTVVSRGVRVRHADFASEACERCHGGVGHAVEGRWRESVAMDDCTGCHKTFGGETGGCETCHPRPSAAAGSRGGRSEGATPWRASHGAGWSQSHGMGDLSGCPGCHRPSYCKGCHGVEMPHPGSWQRTHGKAAAAPGAKCETCHELSWCTSCHGLRMPHPAGFLPNHGLEAERAGTSVCLRCHGQESCDECHYRSAHPNVPKTGFRRSGG